MLMVILASLGGLVVVLMLVMLFVYVLISRRLMRQLRRTVEDMEQLLTDRIQAEFSSTHAGNSLIDAALLRGLLGSGRKQTGQSSNVPPMRICVRSVPYPTKTPLNDSFSQRIHDWLLSHSFNAVGDYYIEEFDGELLSVYLSSDQLLVAAIRYQSHHSEPYVEFCFDLGDGARGGVSNPPGSPIALPVDAIGKYYPERLSENFELLSRMWLEAKELIDLHVVYRVAPADVSGFFEEAHSAEMNYRIASGGVTEDEIRNSFMAQGLAVTKRDVEEIQRQWQEAIEQHLLDYSARGRRHQGLGREILIVHEGSVGSYLVHRIELQLVQMQECEQPLLQEMASELKTLLRKFSAREAMARFRPLLPQRLRYELIDQLQQPVEADLYALPNFCRSGSYSQ